MPTHGHNSKFGDVIHRTPPVGPHQQHPPDPTASHPLATTHKHHRLRPQGTALRRPISRSDHPDPSSWFPSNSEGNEEIDFDWGELYTGDVYEYQEGVPQEESRKNCQFDPVKNFEYELPENYKVHSLSINLCCGALCCGI
ncbi:hypothetical protein FH972_026681 [Carpinus fangiana]|uniref:Uncharacterized protein n=1 Tax=Carpinus fangiana TaxID=176857 RepID=A0A5N6L4T3_9ROSI|nr:hypothetical protein FH972_026681 [Carpinus fangiana]